MSVLQKDFWKGFTAMVVWLWLLSGYTPFFSGHAEMQNAHDIVFGGYISALIVFFVGGPVITIYCFTIHIRLLNGKSVWGRRNAAFLSPFTLAWLVIVACLIGTGLGSVRTLPTLLVIAAFVYILVCTIMLVFPKKRQDPIQTS